MNNSVTDPTAHKVLVTCPPMLGMIDSFQGLFAQHGLTVTAPKVVQTLSVEELIELVPSMTAGSSATTPPPAPCSRPARPGGSRPP
jgi:hypothetical protein